MKANIIIKKTIVKEIVAKIKNSYTIVVVEYAGLKVKEIQELKSQLKNINVEMKIYKNRLVKIALKETNLEALAKKLVGPNAFVFGTKDDIAIAKILDRYAKDHKALKLKAGTYEGKLIDSKMLSELAMLPSMEEALTMLTTSMLAPITQIGKGLFLIIDEGHIEKDKSSKNKIKKTKVEIDTQKTKVELDAQETKAKIDTQKTKVEVDAQETKTKTK